MDQSPARKMMTFGEGRTALVFAVTALLCLIAAARAEDAPFAFHAYLSAAASVLAIFMIVSSYSRRSSEPIPAEIDGRPNYNYGPVKFATVAAMFWGIAGFIVGLWASLELAWPALNFDLPWTNFGRLRPLHTSAV